MATNPAVQAHYDSERARMEEDETLFKDLEEDIRGLLAKVADLDSRPNTGWTEVDQALLDDIKARGMSAQGRIRALAGLHPTPVAPPPDPEVGLGSSIDGGEAGSIRTSRGTTTKR